MLRRADHVLVAEQLLRDRRVRDVVFADYGGGFGEPAWDMLLTLFIAGDAGAEMSALIEALPVPPQATETYARWLETARLATALGTRLCIADAGSELIAAFIEKRR